MHRVVAEQISFGRQSIWAVVLAILAPLGAQAQVNVLSAWDAAEFRIWGYIPYWATQTQINNFATNGMYTHVSDVLYFGGVRPDASGNLTIPSTTYQNALSTLRTQSASNDFNLHLSMMAVTGGSVDTVWNSISSSPANRANFVSQLKTLMMGAAGTADDIKGFNFDWERPNLGSEWGNYTQLARELKNAFLDPSTPSTHHWEVTVCDYGSTDTDWDNTSMFDAKVYDQLFIMIYHLGASAVNTYANQKLALTQQGANKAFSDDQLGIGFGTWGTGGPATVALSTFVAANPNLAYDATTVSGTYNDVNGVSRTGTWTIESRKQVREKTQAAMDRGMPGMFSWTLHYDATNKMSLHRVMHHYVMVQREIPDLNLDGKVNATDANDLANNMGTSLAWAGMATDAEFDKYYLEGNWEKGDHDGNGYVNQVDANWLAARYTELGVNLPDRLAFTGTFENFKSSRGLSGRWRSQRDAEGELGETSNFLQHGSGYLSWTGTGVGAEKRSTFAVTLRNQNSAENAAGLNKQPRMMDVDLTTPIDLGSSQETYFTFLVRQSTAPLLASHLTSNHRTLSLEFLDSEGNSQFDFSFRGKQQTIEINSVADTAGQDVSAGGFGQNTTYLLVGKIAGNGSGANTLQAALFASGAAVPNFASPSFPWALTAQSSADFNPTITQLQFKSLYEANYTVSNVWMGTAMDFFALPSAAMGDYNNDGSVDAADYIVWRHAMTNGTPYPSADGDGNGVINSGDYGSWSLNFAKVNGGGGSGGSEPVPEPLTGVSAVIAMACLFAARRQRRGC